jgi:pyruvate/2-oxoglutarate dehydrogenase complex dihydrolipoamide acyltransferase (E2) component
MAPRSSRIPLVVPDVGLDGLTLSLWLVPPGGPVLEGDRVAELVGGGATIDLVAPLEGRLVAWLVDEDEPVTAGTVLAEFEPMAGDAVANALSGGEDA